MHRVVNKLGRERYSIPFFVIPNFDAEVRFQSKYNPTSIRRFNMNILVYSEAVAVRQTLSNNTPASKKTEMLSPESN